MKKPSKLETFNKNLALPKSERAVPNTGIAARLAIHEAKIERLLTGIETSWVEIGKELYEIQSEGDFAETTFEQYVKNRWSKTRDWAYKMIQGYKVKAELPENVESIIQNQAQALAVKKAPKEKRAAVLKEAKKQGDTSPKNIKEIAESKKDEPKEAEFRVIVKDFNGEEVPENIADEFQRAEREAKEQIGNCQQIKNYLERDDLNTVEARNSRETVKDLLAALKTHLTKHVLCPKCGGKKCAVCSKRGFVSYHFATKGIGKK